MSNLPKNLVYSGIIILAVIALVLGYLIYKQSPLFPVQKTKEPQIVQQTQSTQSQKITEKNILQSFPDTNSSDEIKKEFFEAIESLARESGILDITNCQPNPLVLKVRKDKEITFKNNSANEYKIIIDNAHQYLMPAQSTKIITTNLRAGTFGYRCEGIGFENQPLVGIVYVVD